ncbi:cysteine synthase A [Olsenella sp. AF16-14LB]|jgi:cysteine synthase A|uniref:cysteine synthase A n=2 Tax=Coriobacteriales TaxID=84999 RepID=UPI000E44C32F|nr:MULTISPECIES: cysteine synthase A [unclassified Olsenella]RGJ46367.1 cysteine synthase A [Olsenella sp. TM06-36]RGS52601.1 cysteine synthase A [Olsenella sp. AF21-51]RGU52394.1 cysteine synthase A [Olsenella sp. AF16-14LB]RGU83636.1 cysteine synthase A [Olsenella sp. AF15-43LB]RHB56352.1 cysteine synthase A [Olsenella sp. AM39-30AC]
MKAARKIEALIGSTPLVDLSGLVDGAATIYGKYEATNPGGSVKDRIARAMLDAAEKDGSLKPGGTVIEPTSGNTGVGLAMLAAARGYKMILVMPETMSIERRKLAASYGAQIVLTPGKDGMKGAVAKAEELRQETPGAIVAGQFVNPSNPQAHYETTGPEVWADTEGTVDFIVAGVGTGGTISGTARFLKEKKASVQGIAVEPAESAVLEGKPAGPHKIQGIGAGFVPKTYDASVVDEVVPVASATAIDTKKRLAADYGLLVGISSGAAVAAAVELAKRPENAGKVIVAILPDTGERYLSMDL